MSEADRTFAGKVRTGEPAAAAPLIAGAFGAALAYATLRYNVFRGVPWADWPSYTLNKALAVASLLLIAAAVIRLRRPGRRIATIMVAAGALGLAHSLLSFALLDPLYYERLYEGGKLTFAAGLSLALGVAATAAMDVGARKSSGWTPARRHAALALIAFAVGLHAALPAFGTWIAPGTWPGGLPPLTLISFLTGSAALAAWLRRPATKETDVRS